MKPEDKITVEITLAELAKVYAIMGKANGPACPHSLWELARAKFDPEQSVYYKFVFKKSGAEALKYSEYRLDWEHALFRQETEQQKQIRELKETIHEAQKQIAELEGVV